MVETIDPLGDPRYDEYVRRHDRATPYHAGAWAKILRSAYGFEPAYLAVYGEDGAPEGVMPLMFTRGVVSGRRLRGLPTVPACGPLASTADGEAALIAAACRKAEEKKARVLTFVSRTPGYSERVDGLGERETVPTWITPLDGAPDELRRSWKKGSNNLFRSIAKAEKNGVTAREGRTDGDLRTFYRLYLETMKRHRSLPRSWRQMSLDMELLGPPGVFRLFLAEHEGEVVAAAIFHALSDEVTLLYAGSSTSERHLRANFALYWHALQWASENGYRRLDWGAAREGGTLWRFKSQWSAERVAEYVYEYVAGDPAAATRAARMREAHDTLDTGGGRSRRQELVDSAWDRAPLRLTAMAGALAYRLF